MQDPKLKAKVAQLKADLQRFETQLYQLEKELNPLDPNLNDEDEKTLEEALAFKARFNGIAPAFFGYPGNLTEDSPLVSRLRALESGLYYVNNAGDPYEQGDSSLDGKVYERKILDLFYEKFEMEPSTSWGYVTSGGSESNTWAIRNGFRRFPQGHMYFSSAAHYSVLKAVTNGTATLFPHTVIPQTSPSDERIDITILFDEIEKCWKQSHQNPILLLTWGTTKMGWCDDVVSITQRLKTLGIPYYLHVDAAYFGGIPNHQINAPVCPSLKILGADSVSVSFHKYFGVPAINSVVLSTSKGDGELVSYLGHRDTTVSGSRTFPIFSATQRIKEVLQRSPEDEYSRNLIFMEMKLKHSGLVYFRAPLSSIFVIPLPSETVRKKYNLASFEGKSGQVTLSHFIVNPFHSISDLSDLVKDLSDDQQEHPTILDL